MAKKSKCDESDEECDENIVRECGFGVDVDRRILE